MKGRNFLTAFFADPSFFAALRSGMAFHIFAMFQSARFLRWISKTPRRASAPVLEIGQAPAAVRQAPARQGS